MLVRRIHGLLGATGLLCALVLAVGVAPPAHSSSDGEWSAFNVFSRYQVRGAAAVYDPDRDRVIAFGPDNAVNVLDLSDGAVWSPVPTQGAPPDARYWLTGVYDPVR